MVGGQGVIVAYAAQRGFTSQAAGIMLACVPGGMLMGDLLIGRFLQPAARTRMVAPLIAVLGLPLVLLAADPPMPVALGLMAVAGGGFAYSLGVQRDFLDAVPHEHRGQAFGLLTIGLMTLQGLGPVVFGALGHVTSIHTALTAAGAAAVTTAAAWQATKVREELSLRSRKPSTPTMFLRRRTTMSLALDPVAQDLLFREARTANSFTTSP